jgi:type I restriction enzyme, S subunit
VCFPGFKGLCSADAYPIWPDEKQLNAKYLALYMLGPIFEKRAVACSMRTGMPKINREDLESIPILIPPLPLQREITEVIKVWDAAIATTEKLLANSRRQKQIVSQALLIGRRRLLETEPWKKRTLSDLIVESRFPGSTGAVARKITVKLYGKGVVAKEERRAA